MKPVMQKNKSADANKQPAPQDNHRVRVTIAINCPPEQVEEFLGRNTAFEHSRALGNFTWKFSVVGLDRGERTLLRAILKRSTKANTRLPLASYLDAITLKAYAMAELRNVKALIETGVIATTDGQPAGRRSLIGGPLVQGLVQGAQIKPDFIEDRALRAITAAVPVKQPAKLKQQRVNT